MSRSSWFASAIGIVAIAFIADSGCTKKAEQPEPPPPAPLATGAPAQPPQPGATAAGAPGAFGKGGVAGKVTFLGQVPAPKSITTPDSFCSRQKIVDEEVSASPAGALKNVLVRVTNVAGSYPPPPTPAVVDQVGCLYRPRVQAVIAGQPVHIKNSDQTLHNVHTYRGASTLFNQAQIPGMSPIVKTFADGGQIIRFRCDVHPWMNGYVAVNAHPFTAVSDTDGRYAIERLPAGKYTIEAWHERLGTRTAELTVADGLVSDLNFEFKAP
jgi:plastocyanin